MTPLSLAWLLHLAVLCQMINLLTGQHRGVNKCRNSCKNTTSKIIPVAFLSGYKQTQASCGGTVILQTKANKFICADSKEKWVQEAMAHLDRQAAAPAQSGHGGTFEKQIGGGEARTTPVARGTCQNAESEPGAVVQGCSLELTTPSQGTQTASGTSSELPTGTSGFPQTRPTSASTAQDRGSPAASEGTKLPTTIAWQSSAAYLSGSGLGVERKSSEAPSTEAPSTEAPSTEAPSTEGPSTEAPSTEALSTMPETSLGPEKVASTLAHTDVFPAWGPGSMAPVSSEGAPSREPRTSVSWTPRSKDPIHTTVDPQRLSVLITPVPKSRAATQRQAVGLLAFLGFLFCLGVVMFAYQSLQGCPRRVAGDMIEGLRYVPRSCGSNSYVLVPV
ncbi:fractalkine isoform X3 [Choloepus didactylus]|uniref:fractalkine isoform X2 n=1 Tax=Choloepus didactylus TaxID=27675 RepID=UPI00189DE94B|nr:fractalkine isoform X2 [Choloepus didactylus]XP_037671925.1 fractalkine isoform X3 [Choloepus didactylus]